MDSPASSPPISHSARFSYRRKCYPNTDALSSFAYTGPLQKRRHTHPLPQAASASSAEQPTPTSEHKMGACRAFNGMRPSPSAGSLPFIRGGHHTGSSRKRMVHTMDLIPPLCLIICGRRAGRRTENTCCNQSPHNSSGCNLRPGFTDSPAREYGHQPIRCFTALVHCVLPLRLTPPTYLKKTEKQGLLLSEQLHSIDETYLRSQYAQRYLRKQHLRFASRMFCATIPAQKDGRIT